MKINGYQSADVSVPSGVPQGDHLSSLLFSLFVNGLKFAIPDRRYLMFADDLKLFRKIQSVADYVTLQKEIDSLILWFNLIQIKITFRHKYS